MGDHMAIREEEKAAEQAFDNYLRSCGVADQDWDEGGDPPDLLLRCGGREYAVEVTQLHAQYPQASGRTISEPGICKVASKITDEVEAEAKRRGILRGTYLIAFDDPYDNFNGCRKEVRDALLDFIASTRDEEHTPWQMRHTAGGQVFHLQKLRIAPNMVGESVSGGGGWEGEIREQLRDLVDDAVAVKSRKLTKGRVSRPWVLLLLDRFYVGREPKYPLLRAYFGRKAEEGVGPVVDFHAVYVIDSDGKVHPIYPAKDVLWGG
jgi:hypothetical protein